MMNLESERLKYKPLSLEQLEDMYLQFSDEEMCQIFSDPPCTMDEAKEIIAHYSSNAANS